MLLASDTKVNGPHMHEWIRTRTPLDLFSLPGNIMLSCLSSAQPLHTNVLDLEIRQSLNQVRQSVEVLHIVGVNHMYHNLHKMLLSCTKGSCFLDDASNV